MSFEERKFAQEKHHVAFTEVYGRMKNDICEFFNSLKPFSRRLAFWNKQSTEVKLAILEHHAKLMLDHPAKKGELTDAYACFNSLKGTDVDIIKTKKLFVVSMIVSVVKHRPLKYLFSPYGGPVFWKVCQTWIKGKIHEYGSKETIDFFQLQEELPIDFEQTIKRSKKSGAFDADAKLYKEFANSYWEKLHPSQEVI